MPLSLLYTAESCSTQINEQDFNRFALEECFLKICSDHEEIEVFLDTLSTPLTDIDSIKYRQNILKDFESNQELFIDLFGFFSRFKQCRDAWKQYNRTHKSSIHSTDLRSSRDVAITLCRTNANNLKSGLLFLSELHSILSNHSFSSTGLINLKEKLDNYISNPSFKELILLSSRLENISIAAPINLKLLLDERGFISSADLIDSPMIFIDPSKKKNLFGKRKEDTTKKRILLAPNNNTFYSELASSPFFDLSKFTSQISQQIFDEFIGIHRELVFYKVALSYIDFLQQKNVPYIFPELRTEKNTSFNDLYELGLICLKQDISTIVPHTIDYRRNSNIVVFGKNSSGKTIFLKSYAILHILSQSGLPVAAKKADVKVYNKFFTLFAEKELQQTYDEIGRFEYEVELMDRLINQISSNSLVILNEPFQTTSYDESAKGLSDILHFFSKNHIDWILVSHITQIKYYMSSGDASFMETTNCYNLTHISHLT